MEERSSARDKKKVRDLNATLGLEDEAGFTMVSPLKRTWSRRGQTPVTRTNIDHHDRLNILGILLVSPKGKKIRLSIKSYWHSLTGEEVIAFLKQILRLVRGYIVLVWTAIQFTNAKRFRILFNRTNVSLFLNFQSLLPNSIQQSLSGRKRLSMSQELLRMINMNCKQMFSQAFHELEFRNRACFLACMALNLIGSINGLTFFKNQ